MRFFDIDFVSKVTGVHIDRLRDWVILGHIIPTEINNSIENTHKWTFDDICNVYLFNNLMQMGIGKVLASRIISKIDWDKVSPINKYITIELELDYDSDNLPGQIDVHHHDGDDFNAIEGALDNATLETVYLCMDTHIISDYLKQRIGEELNK